MSLLQLKLFQNIYIYRPIVDFRKGIIGLASIVQDEMNLSPFDSSLFLFSNRHHNKLKALYWDSTGFALWYKILEQDRFKWPKHLVEENVTVDVVKLEEFLQGLNPWQVPHKELDYDKV